MPVRYAAARLYQLGSRKVSEVHQRRRCEAREPKAFVRRVLEYQRRGVGCSANRHFVARLDAELREQLRVQPHGAALRNRICGVLLGERARGDAYDSAQRVAIGDRLQICEYALVAGKYHARE
ncbi:MAG: hypothetical protein LC632_01240 [Xanthomonadaceae bacterium]|nr:hypothetical protein [Xanthomonadaceae bacterium]